MRANSRFTALLSCSFGSVSDRTDETKKRENVKKAREEPAIAETKIADGCGITLYEVPSPAYKYEMIRRKYGPTSPAFNVDSRLYASESRAHDTDTYDSDANYSDEEDATRHRDALQQKHKKSIRQGGQSRRIETAVAVAYGIFSVFFLITFVLGIYDLRPMKSRCKDRDIYALMGKTGIGKSSFIAQLDGKDRFGFSPKVCGSQDSCGSAPFKLAIERWLTSLRDYPKYLLRNDV